MDIELINSENYRSLQIAQTAYMLALREMALVDYISVACMCNITKEEAQRLSSTPIHVVEAIFIQLPPMLNFNGVKDDNGRLTHSIIDLFDVVDNDQMDSFSVTTQHLLALNLNDKLNNSAGR